jgi:hypothetical protein
MPMNSAQKSFLSAAALCGVAVAGYLACGRLDDHAAPAAAPGPEQALADAKDNMRNDRRYLEDGLRRRQRDGAAITDRMIDDIGYQAAVLAEKNLQALRAGIKIDTSAYTRTLSPSLYEWVNVNGTHNGCMLGRESGKLGAYYNRQAVWHGVYDLTCDGGTGALATFTQTLPQDISVTYDLNRDTAFYRGLDRQNGSITPVPFDKLPEKEQAMIRAIRADIEKTIAAETDYAANFAPAHWGAIMAETERAIAAVPAPVKPAP